jgi:hypothetical protein
LREKKTNKVNDLLEIWKDPNQEFTYKELLQQMAKVKGVSERQASDYFPSLRVKLQLRKYRQNTLYKPRPEAWKQYLELKQQAVEINTFVRDTIDSSVSDASLLTKEIRDRFFSEVNFNEEDGKEATAFDLAINKIYDDKPEKTTLEEFYPLYDKLIKSCLNPLSDPQVFARLALDQELPDIVEQQVSNLITKFMDIWAFAYKHRGFAHVVTDILAEDDPRQRRAKKIAHFGHQHCNEAQP